MNIAAIAGAMLGGALAVFILSFVLEKLVFQRINDDPVAGKLNSVLAAWAVASTVWGFNSMHWNGFNPNGLWIYGIPAIFIGMYAHSRGLALRELQDEPSLHPFDTEAAKPFE